MSAEAFGADWSQLEGYTFRFRDPLNKNLRFIPLRLDDTPSKGSIAQFSHIKWRSNESDQEYLKLLKACVYIEESEPCNSYDGKLFHNGSSQYGKIFSVCPTLDSKTFFSSSEDGSIRQWSTDDGSLLNTLSGHKLDVHSLALSTCGSLLYSASNDKEVRVWEVKTGHCKHVLKTDHYLNAICKHPRKNMIAVGTDDGFVQVWNMSSKRRIFF